MPLQSLGASLPAGPLTLSLLVQEGDRHLLPSQPSLEACSLADPGPPAPAAADEGLAEHKVSGGQFCSSCYSVGGAGLLRLLFSKTKGISGPVPLKATVCHVERHSGRRLLHAHHN